MPEQYLNGVLTTSIWLIIQLGLNTLWNKLKINTYNDILVIIPSVILAIAALPISLILLSIPWAYKQIVHITLMLTIRDKYFGLISGCNVIISLGEGKEPAAITLTFILDSDKTGNEVYTATKARIEEIMKLPQYEKFFTVRKEFMGYSYLEKKNLQIDEIIGTIEGTDLREFMNKYCHKEMPVNFDVYVGRDRIQDLGYPIALRVHHCLADGLSLYTLITRLFCRTNNDNRKDDYAKKLADGLSRNIPRKGIWETVCGFRRAKIDSCFPVTCSNDVFSDENDSETILTYLFERDVKYLPTIKRIKKRFLNMNFNTVILTAFSASLAEFYVKKADFDDIPVSIHTGMMAQVNFKRFKHAYSSGDESQITNDFSLLYPQISIVPSEFRGVPIDEYVVDRLIAMQEEFTRLMDSPEYITNYTMFNTLTAVLPNFLLKILYMLGKMTVAFSSMPGGPELEFINGDKVQDVIFFTPKQVIAGICLTILTYGNKLQLGLKANRSKCNNVEELDAILQGVFRYIDILDEKTTNY